MSNSSICISCRKPKAETDCGVCGEGICRKCRLFQPEGSFSYWSEPLAPELTHVNYCGGCFDAHVGPFKARYDELMDAARKINVFYKDSNSLFRIIRKSVRMLEVSEVTDRDDLVMRMAFMTAIAGYNSLVDVEISSKKVRNEGYQTQVWSGRGWSADIKSKETASFD